MNNPLIQTNDVMFYLECIYRQCVLVAEAYEKSKMESLANVYWHKSAVYAEAVLVEIQKKLHDEHGLSHDDILSISDSV